MKYRLTEAALQDVRDIVDHIREIQKSPQNAQLVATRLKEAFEKLASSPSLSHVRRELQDDNARVYRTSEFSSFTTRRTGHSSSCG